jgi:hypothetical protein
MPHLRTTYSFSEIDERYRLRNQGMSILNWSIPRSKAEVLRDKVRTKVEVNVSVQDCLTGLVVSLINCCGDEGKVLVKRVTNAASVGRVLVELGRISHSPFLLVS